MNSWFESKLKNFYTETISDSSFINSSHWDGKKLSKEISLSLIKDDFEKLKYYWKYINANHLLN